MFGRFYQGVLAGYVVLLGFRAVTVAVESLSSITVTKAANVVVLIAGRVEPFFGAVVSAFQ